jgi:hypothetical protein
MHGEGIFDDYSNQTYSSLMTFREPSLEAASDFPALNDAVDDYFHILMFD